MPSIARWDSQSAPAETRGLVAVDGRNFPLKSAALKIRAEGGIASTTLVQAYDNPYPEPLEVFYTLPLPADGAVIGYRIRLGEKVIRGEVQRREDAEKNYRRALEEGKTAGLLEEERADTFTQSLGNLPPGAKVGVEIEVLQPLLFVPGAANLRPRWQYRFPTVAGVRYEGAPGRVPDADRLDPDRADEKGTPVRMEIDLLVADGPPETTVPTSSSHAMRVSAAEGGTRLTLGEGTKMDRDLVVEWLPAGESVELRLTLGTGLEGDPGRYGLLTLTPPESPGVKLARDLTLLIDASGSMGGTPLELAKKVASGLLESLDAGDRFEILAFANEVVDLTDGVLEANPRHLDRALGQLARLHAGGGTEMVRAAAAALRPLRPGSQRQVILITDGYIGFEQEVVAEILRSLPEGARLHTVGIGAAPNRTLLQSAARAGRGMEIIVGDPRSLESATLRLRQATEAPLLTELSVGGIAVQGVAPGRPRDVMAGQPILIAVELRNQGGRIEVRGKLAGSAGVWVRSLEVMPGGEGGELPLGALFGREAVEDCEMRLAAADSSGRQRILDEIEGLGLRHRIATCRTSLVAISEDPTVDPRDPRRRERLPVELPAGVSAEGVGLRGATLLVDRAMASRAMAARPKFSRLVSLAELGALESRGKSDLEVRESFAESRVVARFLRVEGDLLVAEFEAPWEKFLLPGAGDPIVVRFLDGRATPALVDEAASTQRGPHASGLTLRLAVRLTAGCPWPAGPALLRWEVDGRAVVLVVDLP